MPMERAVPAMIFMAASTSLALRSAIFCSAIPRTWSAVRLATLVVCGVPEPLATPAPPVGTALGQHGVNIMEFCRQYNEQTQQFNGQVIPAELTIYEGRSFSFITKQPPAAELIKQAAGLDKGSGEPNRTKVAKLTDAQVRTIAEQKMADLNANDVEQAMKIIAGTARSMGVEVGA